MQLVRNIEVLKELQNQGFIKLKPTTGSMKLPLTNTIVNDCSIAESKNEFTFKNSKFITKRDENSNSLYCYILS